MVSYKGFQSTLPVWGGTAQVSVQPRSVGISIHPPRVGRDVVSFFVTTGIIISIHPPRVGRDFGGCLLFRFGHFISIHPPRVGRDTSQPGRVDTILISIHPPRVGRDLAKFRQTPHAPISIHPPRVGRDTERDSLHNPGGNFNPPSPCGEGLQAPNLARYSVLFQSTLPVWGGTLTLSSRLPAHLYFNPPSPCGEGPSSVRLCRFNSYFNPPSPCGEGQQKLTKILCKLLR